ncbi:MAG: hypothetical protein KDH89_19335, partial [Anaerolineae bacterium]|nr:hypothetical protein [Anaerolineae bacterium]
MTRWLETDSLSNQNIASATAIGAYTADADRSVLVDVSLDQVAGNGDYVIYITRQISGAGSAYVVLPKTTATAASGETAIAMQSGAITVRSGDVLTVYVDGLAGDTTTVDTICRWFDAGVVDLVDAPNATAVEAIQSGLATGSEISAQNDALRSAIKAVIAARANFFVPGTVYSSVTIASGSLQSGVYSNALVFNGSAMEIGGSTSIDFYVRCDG